MSFRSEQARRRHVEELVLLGQLSEAAIDDIIDAGLAGYAVDRIAVGRGAAGSVAAGREPGAITDALADPRIRQARMLLAARHATLRRAVVRLLGAWNGAGIEALLFKGFYLAEFVYRDSSIRKYSDVDVGLRWLPDAGLGGTKADLAKRAADIALLQGWKVIWYLGQPDSIGSHHDPAYDGHELLLLQHESSGVPLDAHRRLVHKNANLSKRRDGGDAVTEMVWTAAEFAQLDDVPVRLLKPVDAVLVGLIAARSWSGDRYRLRPQDLLDLEALMALGDFDRSSLLERAGSLGLAATTRLFLRRCDLQRRAIDLRAPSTPEVFYYDTLLLRERGHRGLEQLLAAAVRLPDKYLAVLRAFPDVARHVWRRRAGRPLVWGRQDEPPELPARALDRRAWQLLQYGVRRALQMHGVAPEADRELALACLFRSSKAGGFEVERHTSEGRVWFEVGGEVLSLARLGSAGAVNGSQKGWQLTPPAPTRRARQSAFRGRVGRLWSLGIDGIRLRLEALYHLRRIVRALERTPFKTLHAELVGRNLATRTAPSKAFPQAALDLSAIGRATESAAQFVPEALCVAQSLAAQVMLNRRQVSSVIHFGFKRSPLGQVEGHAWLEADGVVITGDVGLDDFTRTATFEG